MSLRRTTVISLVAALTALGSVGGVTAYVSGLHDAAAFLDLQQSQIARYIGELAAPDPQDAATIAHDPEDDYVVTVRHLDGRPLRSTSSETVLPPAVTTGFSEFENAVGRWRVYALVSADRTVQVAQQVVVREELAQEAALRATLPFALAIPIAWLVVELVARVVFRRLESAASSIARREAHDLSPVSSDGVPAEVRPLVAAMNELLDRLRLAMARQRIFLSDAAHELRTPLTALTLQIANLRETLTDASHVARVRELEAGVRRASALTRQLLRIARYDSAEGAPAQDPVALDELALEVVAGLVTLADERSIDLGMTGRQPATVLGSAAEFRTLIEVLVDNAVRYTARGGLVDVAVATTGDLATVTVADNGPGVPEDELPRLCERFYRSPSADSEGSGMGLAIAEAVARRHGVRLELANRRDRTGFVATLVFEAMRSGPGTLP